MLLFMIKTYRKVEKYTRNIQKEEENAFFDCILLAKNLFIL